MNPGVEMGSRGKNEKENYFSHNILTDLKILNFYFYHLTKWGGHDSKIVYSHKVKSKTESALMISYVPKSNTLRMRANTKWRSSHQVWNPWAVHSTCLQIVLEENNTNPVEEGVFTLAINLILKLITHVMNGEKTTQNTNKNIIYN